MNATLNHSDVLFRHCRELTSKQFGRLHRRVHLWIPGEPLTQHRPRASSIAGKARLRSDPKTLQNRDSVVNAWQQAVTGWEPWEGPVLLELIACHLPTRDHWEGRHCSKKPDADNGLKLVADALNAIAWRDDRQIVRAISEKVYDVDPGTRIRLTFFHPMEKPLDGRVKVDEDGWDVWDRGAHLGIIRRVKGGYDPTCERRGPLDKCRTLDQAEQAIRKAVGCEA